MRAENGSVLFTATSLASQTGLGTEHFSQPTEGDRCHWRGVYQLTLRAVEEQSPEENLPDATKRKDQERERCSLRETGEDASLLCSEAPVVKHFELSNTSKAWLLGT